MDPAQPQPSGAKRRAEGGRGGGKPSPRPPGPGGRGPRPDEGRKRRGPAPRYLGWGDEVDRVWCAARPHAPATGFPVQARPAAARPVVAVARRDGALLLCDGAHEGPHLWPNLESVAPEEAVPAPGRAEPASPAPPAPATAAPPDGDPERAEAAPAATEAAPPDPVSSETPVPGPGSADADPVDPVPEPE